MPGLSQYNLRVTETQNNVARGRRPHRVRVRLTTEDESTRMKKLVPTVLEAREYSAQAALETKQASRV